MSTSIYSIGNVDNIKTTNGRGNLMIDEESIGQISQEELHLLSHKQLLELEQQLVVNRTGKGSTHDNAYELEIIAVNNALAHIERMHKRKRRKFRHLQIIGRGHAGAPTKRVPQIVPTRHMHLKQRLQQRLHHHKLHATPIAGDDEYDDFVGGKKGKARREKRKTEKAIKRNEKGKGMSKKDQKRLKKLNIVVKKKRDGLLKRIGKGLLKAVTFLPMAIAKGVSTTLLRAVLPKNAPFFLYLFLVDPNDPVKSAKILSKVPDAVMAKRSQELKALKTITKHLGMKEATFYNIIRSGILNRYGMTPEETIAKWMKDANFSVSGFMDVAQKGMDMAKQGLDILGKVFGLNFQEMQDMQPAPEDWGAVSGEDKEDIANGVQNLNTAQLQVPNQTENQMMNSGGGYSGNSFRPTPGSDTGDGYTDGEGVHHDSGWTDTNGVHHEDDPPDDKGGDDATDDAAPAKKNSSTMMMGGLALGAFMLMSPAKGGRKK